MYILKRALNILFPSLCRWCGIPVTSDSEVTCFCSHCWRDIKWFKGPFCPSCGLPYTFFHSKVPQSSASGHPCGSCFKNPPPFDRAIAGGPYEGPLREAVRLFKYEKKLHVGRKLTERVVKLPHISSFFSDSSRYIIPIPLHGRRLREREYNQSAIIGSILRDLAGMPFLLNVLDRCRYTIPQVGLSLRKREENVTGAFTVNNRSLIDGKRILLVDDVYTTGATLKECARILKRYGAARIEVFTIARAVM